MGLEWDISQSIDPFCFSIHVDCLEIIPMPRAVELLFYPIKFAIQ
jgi:hypothetical protein